MGGTLLAVFLACAFYLGYWTLEHRQKQRAEAERIVEIASLGITQKNRALVEATLGLGFEELNATRVVLCHANEILIAYPVHNASCSSEAGAWFRRILTFTASGMPDYRFFLSCPDLATVAPYF